MVIVRKSVLAMVATPPLPFWLAVKKPLTLELGQLHISCSAVALSSLSLGSCKNKIEYLVLRNKLTSRGKLEEALLELMPLTLSHRMLKCLSVCMSVANGVLGLYPYF